MYLCLSDTINRTVNINLQLTVHYVTEVTSEIIESLLAAPYLGLDIETKPKPGTAIPIKGSKAPKPGLDAHLTDIRLIQMVAPGSDTVYVFDMDYVSPSELRGVFEVKDFIAHNAVFELKHLRQLYPQLTNVACTMLLSIITECAERSPFESDDPDEETYITGHRLDQVAHRICGIKIPKTLQTSDWGADFLSDEQLKYAGVDAVAVAQIWEKLSSKLTSYDMWGFYKLLCRMQIAVVEMETTGIGFDLEAHRELVNKWVEQHEQHTKRTLQYFGNVNLRSPKQLGEWLEKRYISSPGVLESWPRTKTGAYTFNRGEISIYAEKDEAIQAYLDFKKTDKLLTTYGAKLAEAVHPLTKRIHGSYFLGSTRTGRLSSGNPNLQNQPRSGELRSCFAASPGSVLVSADYSQIEMRVAGELSCDPVIRGAYEDGMDLHKLIVTRVTGKSYDEVTKEDRQLGKAVNFGLLFGMGPKKLRKYAAMSYGVFLSEEEAYEAYKAFHNTYAVYSAWCNVVREQSKVLGYATTVLGKRRRLLEEEVYTRSVNTKVQGSAAEVLEVALCSLSEVPDRKYSLVCTVHDEILLECQESYADDTSKILKTRMETGFSELFPDATLNGLVDVKVGTNWMEVK